MIVQELIRAKQKGQALPEDDIARLIKRYTDGDVGDDQMAAFLMACYFRGMTYDETIALTRAFIDSGSRLDLSSVTGVKVDKHSTGGVGDKTSLIIAPVVAAAGVPVPMISGRSLGHTGGTLDKLESIPGFRTSLTVNEFVDTLEKTGAVLAGQTDDLVPADRKIYALRDRTSTIEIFPFIAASILSKKIAEGADALALDVKTGDGAFMQDLEKASELAGYLVEVGAAFDLHVSGFITDMDQPLGSAVGNWLEVVEAVDTLQGRGPDDLLSLSLTLSGMMIHLGRKARSISEGVEIARYMIDSGAAFRKLVELVAAQGGDVSVIESTLAYPVPRVMVEVHAERAGFVSSIACRRIGILASRLGAGRLSSGDEIDPLAGMILRKKVGDQVERGEALCQVTAGRDVEDLSEIRREIQRVFSISSSPPEKPPLIHAYFAREGIRAWDTTASGPVR